MQRFFAIFIVFMETKIKYFCIYQNKTTENSIKHSHNVFLFLLKISSLEWAKSMKKHQSIRHLAVIQMDFTLLQEKMSETKKSQKKKYTTEMSFRFLALLMF